MRNEGEFIELFNNPLDLRDFFELLNELSFDLGDPFDMDDFLKEVSLWFLLMIVVCLWCGWFHCMNEISVWFGVGDFIEREGFALVWSGVSFNINIRFN